MNQDYLNLLPKSKFLYFKKAIIIDQKLLTQYIILRYPLDIFDQT